MWLAELLLGLLWWGTDDYEPKAYMVGSAELKRLMDNTIQLYAAKVALRAKFPGPEVSLEVSTDPREADGFPGPTGEGSWPVPKPQLKDAG